MNRYQQLFGDKKKNQNVVDTKFLLNQEGFYSPIREYKKYKKMEEFQLPDIKKYMLPKTDRQRSQGHIESEPTAFQIYKKHQQLSRKNIEEKAYHLKLIENSQQFDLTCSSNNILNTDIQQCEHLPRQKKYIAKKDLRLSLQNLPLKSELQRQQSLLDVESNTYQAEQQQGYNVALSQRFRVSSLELINKVTAKIVQQSTARQTRNQVEHRISLAETSPEANKSTNISIICSNDTNKQIGRQSKHSFLSSNFGKNIYDQQQKIERMNDNLRQSYDQFQQASQSQINSEINGLRCKIACSDDLKVEETNKITLMKKNKERRINSNSIFNGQEKAQGTLNILILAQKQVGTKQQQKQEQQQVKQGDTIEQILLSKNPFLKGQINEANPTIQNRVQNPQQKIWENQLAESEIVNKRKDQYNNQVKSGGSSPLFGSTRFLNFLPHHIKRKKIQTNIQLQQQENQQKQLCKTEQLQEDILNSNQILSQYILTSDTFIQQPSQNQLKQNKKQSYNFKGQAFDQKSNHTSKNPINSHEATSFHIQQSADQDYIQFKPHKNYTHNKITYQDEDKYFPLKVYGSERQAKEGYPLTSRGEYDGYLNQLNSKANKIKIEDQTGLNYQNKQQRLTFTQFLPWENPSKQNQLFQTNKNQVVNDNIPSEIKNKGKPLSGERSLNESADEQRFNEFDINDYFNMKDDK